MSPDVAASVRARLLNQARQRGEEFERTLARFAGERLLFRLGACVARDRRILKGASLLAAGGPAEARCAAEHHWLDLAIEVLIASSVIQRC